MALDNGHNACFAIKQPCVPVFDHITQQKRPNLGAGSPRDLTSSTPPQQPHSPRYDGTHKLGPNNKPLQWLSRHEAGSLFRKEEQGYYCSIFVLAELRVHAKKKGYNYHPSLSSEESRVIEQIATTSIKASIENLETPYTIEKDRIDNIGRRRLLEVALLNGKLCEVKVGKRPAIQGILYYTDRTQGLRVKVQMKQHLKSDSGYQWHVLDIDERDLEQVDNYVAEVDSEA